MTDLFDWNKTVRRSDPETSAEAAIAIAPHVTAMHAKILDALKDGGATASELMNITGMIYNTTWRRLSELKSMGLVANTELRRRNPRNRNEVVVTLTEHS